MWNHHKEDSNIFNAFVTSLPLKRMGTAQEVANAVLYLASDESLYTTGSEIIVEGCTICLWKFSNKKMYNCLLIFKNQHWKCYLTR